MPDDSISISDIAAARAAMTGGTWEVGYDRNDQANIYARGQPTDWIALLPHQCLGSIEEEQKLNAAGICALHAAAPMLIAIAKAALEWKRTLGAPRGDRTADVAERALLDVLAKVTP